MSGIYYDSSVLQIAEQFASTLLLTKCTQSGRPEPLELLPHSRKLVANLLGWKRQDGRRVHRKAYVSMARKNAKTQTLAFLALYQFFFDPEPEQEIYMAATSRDQASVCFTAAANMLRSNPELLTIADIVPSRRLITHRQTGSVLQALSSEGKDKHGSNPSMVIFDELHMWGPSEQELFDALTSGSVARRQSLQVFITTAGVDQQSLCYAEYEYAKRIISKQVEDETYLPLIWETPAEADWTDEANWVAANPTLGRIVQIEEIRTEFRKAINNPREQNKFRRLHLNQWTNAEEAWIPLQRWDVCGQQFTLSDFEGQPCYAGLDLGATRDLTAMVLVFPRDGKYYVWPYFFLPKEDLQDRCRRDRVRYDVWARDGHVILTDGDSTDWRVAVGKALECSQRFDLRSIMFDRAGARDTARELGDHGISVVDFGQGWLSMSPPSKRLEELIYAKQIVHAGHPVLRWNFDCCTIAQDAAGNIKPVKPDRLRDSKRIDGVVALVMALAGAMTHKHSQPFIWTA